MIKDSKRKVSIKAILSAGIFSCLLEPCHVVATVRNAKVRVVAIGARDPLMPGLSFRFGLLYLLALVSSL
jgi:hypothetical protein